MFRHTNTNKKPLCLGLRGGIVVLLLGLFSSALHAETLRLGVLSFRPLAETVVRWQPLADYLGQQLNGRNVELIAANYEELESKIQAGALDFVLTNPAHYVMHRNQSGFSGPLATLLVEEHGYLLSQFGGVVLTLAEYRHINSLNDVPGRRIAAVSRGSLGGYQAQAMALLEEGAPLPNQADLLFTGMPHDRVIDALLTGEVEVGFVRSGVLESLLADGRLAPGQLRVLGSAQGQRYPLALSTELYPEWPLLVLPHVDAELSRLVAAALLLFEPDDQLAAAMGIRGFAVPADYSTVEALARSLRLPPFDQPPSFTWRDVWDKHRYWLVALLVCTGLLLLSTVLLLFYYRRALVAGTQTRQLNRALGESEALLRQITETIREVVWVRSPEQMLYINPAYEQVWGRTTESLYANPDSFIDSAHPDDRERIRQALMDDGVGKQPFDEVYRIVRPNGEVRWLHARSYPVVDDQGRVLRNAGTAVDISDMKGIEEELARSNADLEQFAYVVSHDLRQPLRMVNSYVQMLQRRLEGQLDGDTRQMMQFAIDGAARMDQMLLALLDYSRVGRKGQPIAELESQAVQDEALHFLQPLLEEAGAKLEIEGEWPALMASRDEMTRLLQNLIGNALKYRLAERPLVVQLRGERRGEHWRCCIVDNGIGIPPEQIPRLFQIFQRLHSREQYEGNGIGLALCRRIVERHGGSIWVESAGEGQGSCFCFELPLQGPDGLRAGVCCAVGG